MNNGIIYPIADFVIKVLDKLNIVELFKFIGAKFNPNKTNKDKERGYQRIAVDIYIILKWIFVLALWIFSIHNLFITILIWYLIVTNLYTYFYRHVWCDDAFDPTNFTKERVRRRFLNLFLAFSYSNVCFAYLYRFPYMYNFSWGTENLQPSNLHALWFSVSNSVAANYSVVNPLNDVGNSVAIIQLIITFIFITIIFSKSNP